MWQKALISLVILLIQKILEPLISYVVKKIELKTHTEENKKILIKIMDETDAHKRAIALKSFLNS